MGVHELGHGADSDAKTDALDNLDRTILRLLQADARRSHRDLARAAGSTQPTVSARIRRMEDSGIILGYTVRLDEEAFAGPNLMGAAAVTCHWCKQRTGAPVWAHIASKQHPFCCTTCRDAYRARHETLSRGL